MNTVISKAAIAAIGVLMIGTRTASAIDITTTSQVVNVPLSSIEWGCYSQIRVEPSMSMKRKVMVPVAGSQRDPERTTTSALVPVQGRFFLPPDSARSDLVRKLLGTLSRRM